MSKYVPFIDGNFVDKHEDLDKMAKEIKLEINRLKSQLHSRENNVCICNIVLGLETDFCYFKLGKNDPGDKMVHLLLSFKN